MGFFSMLEARCQKIDSLLCVGLDPHPADLAEWTPQALRAFCLHLIAVTAESAAAFKPNSAFFEAFGAAGIEVLREVIAGIPEGIPVILDAKRGDIASTAEAYAQAAFQTLGTHAITLNPYLGKDSLDPFLGDPDRGVFLLCKTSNPGAADLQDLRVTNGSSAAGLTLYETVALKAQEWNRADNLGLVVGATQPEALERVRSLAPELWFLTPGVGAQGGDLRVALQAGLRADGSGLLIPVSRALARSRDPGAAAESLRKEINTVRREIRETPAAVPGPISLSLSHLAEDLLDSGCVKFGSFTLKSGLQSPIYIDLRSLAGHPSLLALAAQAYLPLLRGLAFNRLAALPYAALPIATAISLLGGWPMVYPRKESKAYGLRADIEGPFNPGEQVVVIDDLATTGESKFEAIEKLSTAGLQVRDVVVLIDRQSGAAAALAEAGFRLHSVFTLTQLLAHWESTGRISPVQATEVRGFLER